MKKALKVIMLLLGASLLVGITLIGIIWSLSKLISSHAERTAHIMG